MINSSTFGISTHILDREKYEKHSLLPVAKLRSRVSFLRFDGCLHTLFDYFFASLVEEGIRL
jgi:hypothetical protein